jgi:DNA-binding NarL/FixJ family response regulator
MGKKISVLLVENDSDFEFLISQMLSKYEDFDYLGYATTKKDAIRMATELDPNIVLMDLGLTADKLDGISTSKEIRRNTNAKVIILTSFENYETVIQASIKSFASGYVFKSQFDLIPQHIKHLAFGHTPDEYLIHSLILNQLTVAEQTILEKILGSDIEINSSNKTIANQKTKIFKKLGLKNQKEVVHILKNFTN